MERNEGRGRVAVVTGGASGIGLATARVLIERGWRVVVSDINVDANHEAADSIGAQAAPFDVSDDAATREAFAGIESRLGPIEALFANAGVIQPGSRPEDLPFAEFDRVIAVNLRGVYVSCVLAGALMVRRHRDHGVGHCDACSPPPRLCAFKGCGSPHGGMPGRRMGSSGCPRQRRFAWLRRHSACRGQHRERQARRSTLGRGRSARSNGRCS
jgi:NAD(P)-dependent dehydrogenase (short-subunit alcohol dehydrogenase family)